MRVNSYEYKRRYQIKCALRVSSYSDAILLVVFLLQ